MPRPYFLSIESILFVLLIEVTARVIGVIFIPRRLSGMRC